jgi:hypothetical protein
MTPLLAHTALVILAHADGRTHRMALIVLNGTPEQALERAERAALNSMPLQERSEWSRRDSYLVDKTVALT